ncbi:MAG: dATP/dGTP diphosphohydrolase domain-containing protein [Planctomycetota bacterium]|jgi:hypothetical protein
MRVAVDFDDTIVYTVPEVLRNFNQNLRLPFGDPVNYGDVDKWQMADILGISDEDLTDLFASTDYSKVSHVEDAVATIRQWTDDYEWDVTVVTANPDEEQIRDWMDDNGLRNVPLVSTPDKVSYLIGNTFDLLIEDNPLTSQEMASVGMSVIMLTRPWNGHVKPELHSTLERCLSWSTLNKHVLPKILFKREGEKAVNLDYQKRSVDQQLWDQIEATPEMDMGYDDDDDDDWYDDVIVNENGAKQTDLAARFDLLPAKAVAEVAAVLQRGAVKYGEENWRGLSVAEIHNHTLGHAVAFNASRELEDLAHTACRALMALEIFLNE